MLCRLTTGVRHVETILLILNCTVVYDREYRVISQREGKILKGINHSHTLFTFYRSTPRRRRVGPIGCSETATRPCSRVSSLLAKSISSTWREGIRRSERTTPPRSLNLVRGQFSSLNSTYYVSLYATLTVTEYSKVLSVYSLLYKPR